MSKVLMNKNGVIINGQSTVLLCSSLFYFRIPSDMWEDRLIKLKMAGYNCLDVYFPWNFHETEEGKWDFTGEKDVVRFLELAKKYQFWVIARPGPYICGEWDGGGLPAYLYTKDITIRDNEPGYLKYVDEWYKRIIPIIAQYQVDNEGTVIAVQVENELDFYYLCRDPKGYISALRDMARGYGITVPIIACVGNFGVEGATGYAEDVVPTMNIYPNYDNPKYEETTYYWYNYLYDRNYPLLVTETGRGHHQLRRLMLNGAKLLGPFNQVGGSCFGYTNAINNWGRPLTFLASDYNFGGFINGQGEVSPEFYEAVLLGNLIKLLGDSLGKAKVVNKQVKFIGKADQEGYPYMLELASGGYLTTVTNYQRENIKVKISIDEEVYPKNTDISLFHLEAPILLYQVPMQFMNLDGTIHFTSLEVANVKVKDNLIQLIGYTNEVGEIQLEFADDVQTVNGSHEWVAKRLIIDLKPGETCTITLVNGKTLEIKAFNRKEAALYDKELDIVNRAEAVSVNVEPQVGELAISDFVKTNLLETDEVKHLEEYGQLRGFGNYHFQFQTNKDVKGIMIQETSDVTSVYLNSNFLGTYVTFNNNLYIPINDGNAKDNNELIVKTEIWGHTNFHDRALPSLHMNALKGLTGVTIIYDIKELGFEFVNNQKAYININLEVVENANYFFGNQSEHWTKLTVNGQEVEYLNHLHNIANITKFVRSGNNIIELESKEDLKLENVKLYQGTPATMQGISMVKEKDIIELTKNVQGNLDNLPVVVPAGKQMVLKINLNDLYGKEAYCIPEGNNLKITAIYNDQVVSRLWINAKNGPRMTGGNAHMIYLPKSFSNKDNILTLLIEGIETEEQTELVKLNFYQVKVVFN